MNDELPAYHSNRRGAVVRTPEALFDAMTREQRGFVVFKKRDYDAWPTNAPPLVGSIREFSSGSKRYVWLEFDLLNIRSQPSQNISHPPPEKPAAP